MQCRYLASSELKEIQKFDVEGGGGETDCFTLNVPYPETLSISRDKEEGTESKEKDPTRGVISRIVAKS